MRKITLSFIWALLFCIAHTGNSQSWNQVWSDEFDGPNLNTNVWNIEVNNLGGYNNELQYYTARPENIRIENGILVIEGRKENYIDRQYTSARINSKGKKSFQYGRMEAKMKLPYGNGMWPAFWMMGEKGNWPASGEIDIMEMVGGNKCGSECGDNKTHGYMWWEENGEKTAGTQSPTLPTGKYADAFHVFAVEWDAQSIKWFIDGVQFYSKSITPSAMSEFHQPFYFLLNLAIGGDWPGSPDNTTVFPQRLYIDYVKVYEKVTCTLPAQPAAISGNTTVIPGSTQTYSIPAVSGATSYTWTLPSGWSGSSSTTSITTVAGSSGGTISVKANNSCGSSPVRTLTVTINCPVPSQPAAITGHTSVTSGSTQTYSIPAVSGATSYTWTLPSGWSGSSTSTSITTTAGSSGGTISVKANNSCGSSPARTLTVTINCPVPSQPGAITGNTNVTPGSSQTYSIPAVSGATSYTWTLPSGWSGSSSTTSITTTAGSSGGTISVKANNSCGSSPASSINVTVNCPVPAQPSAISGNTSVASGSSQTYSISAVSGATSYTWSLPSGWSGSSSSTSITTTVGNSGGTISVKANNSCGSSIARTLAVSVTGTPSGNLALNKQVTTSSIEGTGMEGSKAVDGSTSTRWASVEGIDPQWLYVDLGATYNINRVKIVWETAYGRNYEVQVSSNASTWTPVKTVTANSTLINDHTGLTSTGRYVRILGTARGTQWGYSIYELEVYGTETDNNNNNNGFSLKIEAENYSAMSGIQTEACSDGGLNVGWFDTYDWMSYSISIPTTGTYKISYRVASTTNGKSLRLEKDDGTTHLGTVSVPNTGDWQVWTTVHHYVTLPAGTYSIGITTYTGGLNLNWIEISNEAPASKIAAPTTNSDRISFPNPISNTMYLKAAIEASSEVKVFDMMGTEIMNLSVPAGTTEFSLESLKSGWYMVKITTNGTTVSERIYKQ